MNNFNLCNGHLTIFETLGGILILDGKVKCHPGERHLYLILRDKFLTIIPNLADIIFRKFY